MQKIKWPVLLVTAYMLFYQISPYVGFSDSFIITLFLISPIAMAWMVYRVLKNGTPSQRTFDEYFYEDVDYRRNKIRESGEPNR